MANETQAKPQPQRIPLAKIHDLPGLFSAKQPDKSYGGLVTSIQANGVKEAVILRLREDGEYQLVAGYRRRRASELAKKQDIPAYVYEMTLKEAVTYHARANAYPNNTPIPGKLVTQTPEVPAKGEKAAEPTIPSKDGKVEAVSKTEGKEEKATIPAEAPKKAGKAADPAKPEIPTKDEKAAEPAAPSKDGKAEAVPEAVGKETKPATPTEPPKEAGKVTDPAKPETPTKDEKAAEPAAPSKDGKAEVPKVEGKEVKPVAPTEPPKEAGKAADSAKPEATAKGEKAAEPTAPGKDGKAEATPKAEGKEEKTAAPAESSKEAGKTAEAAKPEVPTTGEKAAEPTTPAKDNKAETAPKADGKETKPAVPTEPTKEADKTTEPTKSETPAKGEMATEPTTPSKDGKTETVPKTEDKGKAGKSVVPTIPSKANKPEKAVVVTGPAAIGPTGTAITKIFEKRLAPPTEQDMKNLPVPNEGESFFITLHPGYLAKSKFNTFSVDTNSDNFKELRKSVELVGIKDPVLTRINPEGGLEILSGQRRHLAAAALNYPVPAIIQKIDDADAKIIVADGNLHRDKISSYDLSRALRMKMEGMKQKSGRRKKGEIKAEELDSDEKLAIEMGMSVSKLNRFIRLSEAVKEVCDRVDDGSLALSIASAISFLKPANQNVLLTFVNRGYKVTNDRVERMKKVEKAGKLDDKKMWEILEDKDIQKTVVPPTPAPAPTPTPAAPTATEPVTLPQSPDVKPAAPMVNEPVPATPVTPDTSTVPTTPTAPEKEPDIFKGAQERAENTKVILTGDRLRRYFPDVNMTPREIEESVYEALEERRQRQMKMQQKTEIFKKSGPTR